MSADTDTGVSPVTVRPVSDMSPAEKAQLISELTPEQALITRVDNIGLIVSEIHNMCYEMYDTVMKIKPVVDNPGALLDSVPPQLRAMLGL